MRCFDVQNWPGGELTKLIGKLLTSEWAPIQNWDQIRLGDGWCSGDKTNLCCCVLLSLCSNLYVLSALIEINYRHLK